MRLHKSENKDGHFSILGANSHLSRNHERSETSVNNIFIHVVFLDDRKHPKQISQTHDFFKKLCNMKSAEK